MKKQTTLTARECISEAAEALGMGDSEKINKCVDHLCEKFYIPRSDGRGHSIPRVAGWL